MSVGREDVERLAQPDERVPQRRRHHHIAHPQRGKQHLAEGADIDHAGPAIHPLERAQRPARVAILAVVVILHDPAVAAPRPREEGEPARRRHGDAERILVRRRHVHEAGATALGGETPDVDPLRVQRDRHHGGPGGAQGVARPGIAGLLDAHRVAGREQRHRAELKRHLRARHDEHMRGVAAHPARDAEVLGDGFPKRDIAGGIAVGHERAGLALAVSPEEAPPDAMREVIQGGHAHAERAQPALVAGCRRGRRRRGRPRRGPRAREVVGNVAGHVAAGAHPALDVPLVEQLLEGVHRGQPRDLELVGERPRRGQPLPGPEPAREDGGAVGVVDLPIERHRRGADERHEGHDLGLGDAPRSDNGHGRFLQKWSL